ncbi:uncharacterized protein A1O9_09895 [Exophiala aquamarina CBS 119918]|uniref:AAA+ ATPase domain-containing protein n=1 Tax=Exophiala aquamarina CBS 119918 TaxID=1182545 RepID=A0A072PET7_9EURO|nr:uncharacterized protein A1O9_09895 [Exophiala aquamarina CBS 119918]KEF54100.1 hypothetical protein A1O9_09895 [Exophiala aquamarina CBS 119918]
MPHTPLPVVGPLSLDGATEQAPVNVAAVEPSGLVDTSRPSSFLQGSSTQVNVSRLSANQTQLRLGNQHGHNSMMLESNPRKRRKITQGNDSAVSCDDQVAVGPETWHEQFTNAAANIHEQIGTEHGGDDSDRSAAQPISTLQDSSSESPVQRSTSLEGSHQTRLDPSSYFLSQPPLPLEANIPVPESELAAAAPSSEEPMMSSPRKTIVRLGANGKLTNSPKRSQKRSPRSANTAVTSRSRKVEMKNRKFASSLRVTLSYTSPACGKTIDEILSVQAEALETPAQALSSPKQSTKGGTEMVHPFFRGKVSTKTRPVSRTNSEPASTAPVSEDEARTSAKQPKAWNNIIFSSRKSSQKLLPGLDPIWPPNAMHNIQPEEQLPITPVASLLATSKSKAKQTVARINEPEDVLRMFAFQLGSGLDQPVQPIHLPTRTIMSGKTLFDVLTLDSLNQPLTNVLKSCIEAQTSSFDRGLASGPNAWSERYAPECWQEVLQPKAQILHDWLSNLEVHNVQSGHVQAKQKPALQKKRRKRKSDEIDDFIAGSDDDELNDKQSSRNAILLTGPSGCGKTASVYAVAHQLGFEVFEINPGMRRNARDIMDQVGDMTQNHLVQKAAGILSRRSSVSASDCEYVPPLPISPPANQKTMASFMGNSKKNKMDFPNTEGGRDLKAKTQKQSLVLFEEVDILFEEDKGFWTAVQALIHTSKRPVILTCNDTSSVPADDLNLYATIEYEKPPLDVAIQYLRSVAASEGHLLSHEAIQNLYLNKGRDLRASLTELNLWCQMTVGSQRGGIDWMMPYNERCSITSDGSVTRIISKDTYINGHDLLPTVTYDSDEFVRFAMDHLDLSALDWVSEDVHYSNNATGLHELDNLLSLCEARSCIDILDDAVSPLIAGQIKKLSASAELVNARDELVKLYLSPHPLHLPQSNIVEALSPLAEETRIGLPQPLGRKAPSMDAASVSLVTDIAPYVRYIVRHDQNLEALRGELDGGSQSGCNKRQRRTRAARAALEGGTKASTRRDKWFSDSLDFDAVLVTGGVWPHAQLGQPQETIEATNFHGPSSSESSTEVC